MENIKIKSNTIKRMIDLANQQFDILQDAFNDGLFSLEAYKALRKPLMIELAMLMEEQERLNSLTRYIATSETGLTVEVYADNLDEATTKIANSCNMSIEWTIKKAE